MAQEDLLDVQFGLENSLLFVNVRHLLPFRAGLVLRQCDSWKNGFMVYSIPSTSSTYRRNANVPASSLRGDEIEPANVKECPNNKQVRICERVER